jgi:hypothetical protein
MAAPAGFGQENRSAIPESGPIVLLIAEWLRSAICQAPQPDDWNTIL